MSSRPPAYSRHLVAARRRHQVPESEDVILHVDSRPPQATNPCHAHLAIFCDTDPEELDFACVANLSVIVMASRERTPAARLRRVLRAVLVADPLRLVVLEQGRSWWVKSAADGVEVAL